MPRTRRARAGGAPILALLFALLLAGCFGWGRNASPEEAKGPAAQVAVHNLGPNDATITMDVTMPNGSHVVESFGVGASKTADHRIGTPAAGAVHVRLTYSWVNGAHGALGMQGIDYDADGCSGAYRVSMDIDTTRGDSWSRKGVECLP